MIAQQMVTEAVSGSWMRGTIRGKKMWPKGRVLRPLNDYLPSCTISHRKIPKLKRTGALRAPAI